MNWLILLMLIVLTEAYYWLTLFYDKPKESVTIGSVFMNKLHCALAAALTFVAFFAARYFFTALKNALDTTSTTNLIIILAVIVAVPVWFGINYYATKAYHKKR